MPDRFPRLARYELNYGWQHDPAWTEETELTLTGRLTDSPAGMKAVQEWFTQLPECERPEEVGRRYHGGCTFELAQVTEDGMVIHLRSSGQDACDSIAYYAFTIRRVVKKAAKAAGEIGETSPRLVWHEEPVSEPPHIAPAGEGSPE